MKVPGGIVDAVADLHEAVEVLRSKIELRVGSAKIKASILPQFTLGVLALMPLTIGGGRNRLKPDRRRTHRQPPRRLRILVVWRQDDRRLTASACERLQRALRFAANDRRRGHKL